MRYQANKTVGKYWQWTKGLIAKKLLIEIDAQGKFSLTLSQAGFYLLSANIDVKGKADATIDVHHYGLYVTLEVFPQ